MASRLDADAIQTIRGVNPQNLIEKILRNRILNCLYWKEHCFGLNAATLVYKAVGLKYVGGAFGGHRKPTPFLCLLTKLLLIQPEKEIVLELLNNEDFKYVRLLAAMYIRLTMPCEDVYKHLERLYSDNRKVTYRKIDGSFEKLYIDEFIDHLLRDERYCDIILPRLTQRRVLEETGRLPPRISALDAELQMAGSDSESESDVSDSSE